MHFTDSIITDQCRLAYYKLCLQYWKLGWRRKNNIKLLFYLFFFKLWLVFCLSFKNFKYLFFEFFRKLGWWSMEYQRLSQPQQSPVSLYIHTVDISGWWIGRLADCVNGQRRCYFVTAWPCCSSSVSRVNGQFSFSLFHSVYYNNWQLKFFSLVWHIPPSNHFLLIHFTWKHLKIHWHFMIYKYKITFYILGHKKPLI